MAVEARVLPTMTGAGVVMRRELRALLSDKQAVYVTVLFGLILPFVISRSVGHSVGGVLVILTQVTLFPFLAAFQAGITSFAGERERGTLGPILATPLSNGSIFVGKLLGVYIPGVATAFAGLVIVLITLPARSRLVLDQVSLRYLVEAVVLSFVGGFVMVVAAVVIGARAKTMRGAQMISGVVFFPILFGVTFVGGEMASHESAGIMSLVGLVAVGVVGLSIAGRVWRREEILTKF